MRSVFIGTSAYGISALEAMVHCAMPPQLVICQPERPAGRKLKPLLQPIAVAARELGLPLLTPEDINSPDSIAQIKAREPDVLITASYGGLLGKELRLLATYKAINLHPSLLPRYRGATPIQSAILAGETCTGTSIFRMTAALDAGPVLAQERLPIEPTDNFASLHDKLAKQAADMLIALLNDPDNWTETPQEHALATYCGKITPTQLEIDWKQPAAKIINQIRAFAPEPAACTYLGDTQLKILEAKLLPESSTGKPGTIHSIIKNTGFTINCQDHPILVLQIQAAGKKALSAAAFINGARLIPGVQTGKG